MQIIKNELKLICDVIDKLPMDDDSVTIKK